MTAKKTDPVTLSGFHSNFANVRTPDYKVIYVNSSKAALGPYDIRLTLGQVVDTADGKTENHETVTVVMSPQEAKAILRVLALTIQQYESMFGAIVDVQALIESAKAPPAS